MRHDATPNHGPFKPQTRKPKPQNSKAKSESPILKPQRPTQAGEERDLEAADSVEVRLQELGGQVGEFEAQPQSEHSLLFCPFYCTINSFEEVALIRTAVVLTIVPATIRDGVLCCAGSEGLIEVLQRA